MTPGRAEATLVLAVNSGSSSVRCALFQVDRNGEPPPSRGRAPREQPLVRGKVAGVGDAGRLTLSAGDGSAVRERAHTAGDHRDALRHLLDAIAAEHDLGGAVVGHRVVHGGPRHRGPARVDASLLRELRALMPLAPLHMRPSLDGIELCAERWPDREQVACFDTAFHRDLPEAARVLPLPLELYEAGVMRYGFHGLSFEHLLDTLPEARRGRTVLAHLGGGCSLAAVRDGRPVDTTMGLTPGGGLMMATRAGDLDPGAILHLLRERRLDAGALERLLDQESGLRGVSGSGAGVRELLDREAADPRAALALATFCHIARRHLGAMAASLEGLDTLVFTGGIGEASAEIRARVCAGLAHLGVALDAERNRAGRGLISAAGSGCAVHVVPADEERVIARQAAATASR